ncbi:pectate lyase [Rhizobium sp. CRIBSB]|nr:pectate lyase [Rhizobium sp. CRIBSB]
MAITILAAAGFTVPVTAVAQSLPDVAAFPGAEGAGRLSRGGRGGRIVRVTSLADAGPGSLRAAVEAQGPRTVIFDIGGTIRLTSPLTIRRGQITIAGQTAPGGGITLADQPLVIAADDVVIRYIRSRLGDRGAVEGSEGDAISISRGSRIILDHVSASWSIDETLSVGSRYDPPERGIYDVTVQWSIIAESLNASGHTKGDHGYGSLVRGGYGARITFHHNLWANHRARMPRPGNYNGPDIDPVGPRFEFRSNVFYNWGGSHSGYNADTASVSTYAFIGNAYVPGPDSTGRWAFEDSDPFSRAFFAGNTMAGTLPDDPWSLVRSDGGPGERLTAPPDWVDPVTEAAAVALERVQARAGASLVRDPVDLRIVAAMTHGTGRIIDSQDAVGGWPELEAGSPWIDTDEDGMPDDWERAHGLDPNAPSDGPTDPDGDGYTLLEDWLNSLVVQ